MTTAITIFNKGPGIILVDHKEVLPGSYYEGNVWCERARLVEEKCSENGSTGNRNG